MSPRHLMTALLLAGLLPGAPDARADTRYVTDSFNITMRRGDDPSFRVIKMLSTGSAVNVLEDNDKGWSRVMVGGDTEGWVLTRFLMTDPPAQVRLPQVEEALTVAEATVRSLREEATHLKERLVNQEQLQQELERIRATAGNALQLERDNARLQERTSQLETELSEARETIRMLDSNAYIQYFMAGAGVLLLGVGMGLFFSPKRRRGNELTL